MRLQRQNTKMAVVLVLWLLVAVLVLSLKTVGFIAVSWLGAFLPLMAFAFFVSGMAAEASEQTENG